MSKEDQWSGSAWSDRSWQHSPASWSSQAWQRGHDAWSAHSGQSGWHGWWTKPEEPQEPSKGKEAWVNESAGKQEAPPKDGKTPAKAAEVSTKTPDGAAPAPAHPAQLAGSAQTMQGKAKGKTWAGKGKVGKGWVPSKGKSPGKGAEEKGQKGLGKGKGKPPVKESEEGQSKQDEKEEEKEEEASEEQASKKPERFGLVTAAGLEKLFGSPTKQATAMSDDGREPPSAVGKTTPAKPGYRSLLTRGLSTQCLKVFVCGAAHAHGRVPGTCLLLECA